MKSIRQLAGVWPVLSLAAGASDAGVEGKDAVGTTIADMRRGVPASALSHEQVASIKQDRANKNTRRMVAVIDGLSCFHHSPCTTREHVLELVEPYRHSDVGKVLWAVTYGDRVNYPSRLGVDAVGDDCRARLVGGGTNPYIIGEKAMRPGTIVEAYRAGVGRFAYWDMDCVQDLPEHWEWLRRVGRRNEMEAWDKRGSRIRRVRLKTVGGCDVFRGLQSAAYSGG